MSSSKSLWNFCSSNKTCHAFCLFPHEQKGALRDLCPPYECPWRKDWIHGIWNRSPLAQRGGTHLFAIGEASIAEKQTRDGPKLGFPQVEGNIPLQAAFAALGRYPQWPAVDKSVYHWLGTRWRNCRCGERVKMCWVSLNITDCLETLPLKLHMSKLHLGDTDHSV